MLNYQNALKIIKKEELRSSNPIPGLLSFLHIDTLYGKNLESILNDYLNIIIDNQRNVKPLLIVSSIKTIYEFLPACNEVN